MQAVRSCWLWQSLPVLRRRRLIHRAVPTDILKWARKEQRHLFPHLAPNGAKTAAKVSDGNRRELARVLKRVLRGVDDLPEPLRAAIKAALD